jgi:hypothetical protein
MPSEEYKKAKEERARNDKKRSMIIFPLLFLLIFSGLVYIVLNR